MAFDFEVKPEEVCVTITIAPPTHQELSVFLRDCPTLRIKPMVMSFTLRLPQRMNWNDSFRVISEKELSFEGVGIPYYKSSSESKKL